MHFHVCHGHVGRLGHVIHTTTQDLHTRWVRKLMLAHPARLTAKSVLFDEEYTGLYRFSVAHT